MASGIRCSSSDFAKTVKAELDKFQIATKEDVKFAVDETVKETLQSIRSNAPVRKTNGGGYKKGWTSKKVADTPTRYSKVAFNSKQPWLTHLLQKPHAIKSHGVDSGRMTKAMDHIPSDSVTEELFLKKLEERMASQS